MKSITAQDATADAALETAIATMLSTYSSIGGLGRVLNRYEAKRILVRRMIAKNRRAAPSLSSTD